MNQYTQWIKHLNEPLVLIGFTTMLLFTLFKTILTVLKKGVINPGVERTINRILLYGFILALIIIFTGFGLSYIKISHQETGKIPQTESETERRSAKSEEHKKGKNTLGAITPDQIKQHTEGNQSPAIISGGDVEINFENE